ncbi:hypothetical protein ACET3Z_024671 [Daucus carota]
MFPSPVPATAYCGYLLKHDHNFCVANHHPSSGNERNKRGVMINTEEVMMGAARWTPTPEQLYALEEIYQTGTRTPSATQIQQIAARLRRFGKIEGKNVFYWFQNHKARERQKRRRQQLRNDPFLNQPHFHGNVPSLGLRRTGFEVGQTKNWVSPSDCSTISEESVVSLATAEVAKGETDERIEFEDTRLRLTMSTNEARNHNKLLVPYKAMTNNTKDERKYPTLELFPDWICDYNDRYRITNAPETDDHRETGTTNISTKFDPPHFFEFLPLKN